MIGNIPAGNILLSGSILFSGALPTQAIRILGHINCATIAVRTFYDHQKRFLAPAVSSIWMTHQTKMIDSLKQLNKKTVHWR